MEDSVGLRDYLFCVGIHISRDSRWRPRSSAVPSRGDAVFDCWPRSLWLDDRAGRALTESAPMDVGILTRRPDLRPRLRTVVLGRATCAFGHCRSHDGHHPGIYSAVGDSFPANAEAHCSPGLGALDRAWRRCRVDEPLTESRRRADRHGGGSRAYPWVDRLVDRIGAYAQAAASAVQG